MKHYFSKIDFVEPDSNECFLTGRCIKILHGVYSQKKIHDVGIAFPDWTQSSLGCSIAFVSQSTHHIDTLISQDYFQQMEHLGYFKIGDIKEHETSNHVIYCRNQRITKTTTGGMCRRLNRHRMRAQARGETYNPRLSGQVIDLTDIHKISITSRSTDNEFVIYVQRCAVDEKRPTTDKVNSYGLSNNAHYNFIVPSFTI